MSWLSFVPGGPLGVLVAAVFAVLGVLGYVARRATVAERNRNLAKEAVVREKRLRDIADAAAAKPVGSVLDDPNNRDNRKKSGV